MTKKKEIIMDLLRELERTIITIMNVLNEPGMEPEVAAEESEGKWIPYSLFPPAPGRHVLVSDNDGHVEEDWIIEVMYLSDRGKKTANEYGWYGHEEDEVVAWMPMPKGIKRDEIKH